MIGRNRGKYGVIFLSLLLTGLVISYFSRSYKEASTSRYSYAASVDYLEKQLHNVDESSPEAKNLRGILRKLRNKEFGASHSTEDPGAFISALREIKTGIDGKTYLPNYKFSELAKARAYRSKYGSRIKNLPWISRGPGNVSGRGRSMAVDPSDPTGNTWFVATVGAGVWKTTNAGDSWEHKTPDILTLSTTSIVMAPSNPDIIYLGTGMGYGRVIDLEGSGIWKSEDHGETWFQLESTANGELLEAVNRIVVDPEDENTLLICSNNSYTSIGPNGGDRKSGIFRSVDGGSTWVQVFDPDDFFGTITDNRVQQIIANPENFNELYASVNEVGVVKSIDGGVTWTVSADDFALPEDIGQGEGTYSGVSTRIELAIAPSNTSRVYASVERPFGTAQLYMSRDAGNTWIQLNNEGDEINWHSANGDSGADGAYTSGWFNHTITVHPFDEEVVFVGGVNLFRIDINSSANTRIVSPIAWRFYPNPFDVSYVHADNHFLITIPDITNQTFRIVCPNDGGVVYSTDGGLSWEQKNGMVSTQFYGVDKKPGEPVYIGGTQDNGTWLSNDDPGIDSSWEHVIGGDGFETVWNYRDPELLMGTSQNGFVRRSEDGGVTWSAVADARGTGGPFISKIANVKTDPDLVFTVTYNGVNRSDNFGKNWQEVNLSPWIGYRPFSNVKISIANPQVVWASSRITQDTYANTGGVHVSRDGGFTFDNITANLPPGLSEASGMATHPELEGTAFLLFSAPGIPKVLRTDDFGETWIDISGFDAPAARKSPSGFPDVAVFTLVVMPYNPDIIWAGTEIGLFVTEDGGGSWEIADNGFPSVSVFDMKIVDDEMVVGTYGRGIWTAKIPEMLEYEYPSSVLAPRLTELVMIPQGSLKINVDLRSEYDSVHILEDDQISVKLFNTQAETDTILLRTVNEDKYLTSSVHAYKNGMKYSSTTLGTDVFQTTPQSSYSNLLKESSAADDFLGDDFSVRQEQGFSNMAIHSPHPYPDQSQLTYQLKVPIIVESENAFFKYKDVALIEKGTTEIYTDADFYDFVIVEGTSDGTTWKALAPGYDARAYAQWLLAYDNEGSGDESMFEGHEIDLLDTFNPGELIFIRFRLSSDPFVNGWGWAIDNIIIQDVTITSSQGETWTEIEIYPNPASDFLHVKFNPGRINRMSILDENGRLVRSIEVGNGERFLDIDMRGLTKGTYFVQVYGDGETITRRIIKK